MNDDAEQPVRGDGRKRIRAPGTLVAALLARPSTGAFGLKVIPTLQIAGEEE